MKKNNHVVAECLQDALEFVVFVQCIKIYLDNCHMIQALQLCLLYFIIFILLKQRAEKWFVKLKMLAWCDVISINQASKLTAYTFHTINQLISAAEETPAQGGAPPSGRKTSAVNGGATQRGGRAATRDNSRRRKRREKTAASAHRHGAGAKWTIS